MAPVVVVVGLGAVACGRPAGPSGWAPPAPIEVESEQVILVPYKGHLYAMPSGSTIARWEFPPRNRDIYPVSEDAKERLSAAIDELDVPDDAKGRLTDLVGQLTVDGPAPDALKDAIDASGAPEAQIDDLKDAVDTVTDFENDAVQDLDAIYGALGLSDDGETLYMTSYSGFVFALDTATGNSRWIRDSQDRFIAGVAVDGDVLYTGTRDDHTVYAINASDGSEAWRFDADGEVWGTPAFTEEMVFVTSLDGTVHALNKDGEEQWSFSASAGIAADPVIDGDRVLVGAYDNKLYALSQSDGSVVWSFEADNWFWGSAVVEDDTVYAASLDSTVYAIDRNTGDERWSRDVGAPVRSSPVFAGGGLVVAARNGDVYKLDAASGEPAAGSPLELSSRILADLSQAGDEVYIVPNNATLYIIDVSGDSLSAPGSVPLPR